MPRLEEEQGNRRRLWPRWPRRGESRPSSSSSVEAGLEASTQASLSLPAVRDARPTSVPSAASDTGSESSNVDVRPEPPGGDNSVPSPSPARHLWDEALAAIDQEEKRLIEKMRTEIPIQGSLGIMIDSLVNLTKKQETTYEAKQWKLRIKGKEFTIREAVSKIAAGLHKFKEIGDMLVKYDPTGYSTLPWQVVGYVVQVATTESEQLSILLDSVDRVIQAVSRSQVYEMLYRPETVSGKPLESLQTALIKQYTAILRLMGHVYKELARSTLVRAVFSVANAGKTGELLDELTKTELAVRVEAGVCENVRSVESDVRLWDASKKLAKLLEGIEGPMLRIDMGIREILQRIRRKERLEILQWVSTIPYNTHHAQIQRAPDTCLWLLGDQNFAKWERKDSSILLWLQGSPGTGKTYLTSKVISHCRDLLVGDRADEGFAIFYCNRIDAVRGDALAVLRSFVRQLCTNVGDMDHIHPKLQELFLTAQMNASDLDIPICQELLDTFVSLYPRSTIILDALDECTNESRTILLDTFVRLLDSSPRPVKIFVSSRPDVDIRIRLADRPNIRIQAKDNHDDIAKFVSREIVKHRNWGRMESDLRDEITTTLLKGSDGMFQWAALQINQLLDLRTEVAIRDRLGKLPATLKDAYDEIYSKIRSRHPYEKILVDRAFQWVACSVVPLGTDDLLKRIHQDPDEDSREERSSGELDKDALLEMSCNLLVCERNSGYYYHDYDEWRLSHLSVAEYFEDNHWSHQQSHGLIAKICLIRLLAEYPDKEIPVDTIEPEIRDSSDIPSSSSGYVKPIHSSVCRFKLGHRRRGRDLLAYSNCHWPLHVQSHQGGAGNIDPRLCTLLKRFLGLPFESSWSYQAWYATSARAAGGEADPPYMFGRSFFDFDLKPRTWALLPACFFGFYPALAKWFEGEDTCAKRNDNGDSLLAIAARMGHVKLCQHLIEKGSNVNELLPSTAGSALAAAASAGRKDVIALLIGSGAKVDLPLNGAYGSALAAAAYCDQQAAVEELIRRGADVNMALRGGWYGSALAAAVYVGNGHVARLLVRYGANVHMKLPRRDCSTALRTAFDAPNFLDRLQMSSLLLELGASDASASQSSLPTV